MSSAERYTLCIVMSAPATLATFRMWLAFEVTTAWFRRTAPSTTETSTMSSWPARAASVPNRPGLGPAKILDVAPLQQA